MAIPTQDMKINKAALFLDFDNIYLGLQKMDPKAAEEFATNPSRWVSWFERGMPTREDQASDHYKHRNLLLRRCYLNPGTFANYRAYFTRSGFSVVDCPLLTQQGKNSTDIHMVMDILDTLRHETRFDEFVLLSGDSDFTPVLLHLRMHDRRTVILTAGPVAQPYKAASDHVISGDVFIEDGLGIFDESPETGGLISPDSESDPDVERTLKEMAETLYEEVSREGNMSAIKLIPILKRFSHFRSSNNWLGFFSLRALISRIIRYKEGMSLIEGDSSWMVTIPPAVNSIIPSSISPAGETESCLPSDGDNELLRQKILKQVREIVGESSEPVNMASVASDVVSCIGREVIDTHWAGAGSFKELLSREENLGFEIITSSDQPGLLYDPKRHNLSSIRSVNKWNDWPPDLKDFAFRINRVTGTPPLTPAEYSLVFEALEAELRQKSYFLTTTSKAVRDRCIEKGNPISRRFVNFIIQGITYAGHKYGNDPYIDKAGNFSLVFKENVISLCENAQLVLLDREKELLNDWIRAK